MNKQTFRVSTIATAALLTSIALSGCVSPQDQGNKTACENITTLTKPIAEGKVGLGAGDSPSETSKVFENLGIQIQGLALNSVTPELNMSLVALSKASTVIAEDFAQTQKTTDEHATTFAKLSYEVNDICKKVGVHPFD